MRTNLKIIDHSVTKEEFYLDYDNELDYYITRPVPNNLPDYYESDNYISHTDSTTNFQDKLYQFVKKINLQHKLKLTNQYANNNKRILDIGAGTGDFLKEAELNGWSISGVEPNPKARNLASSKGIQLVPALENFDDPTFDVITLWHVLEHLPNIEEQIKKIKSLLSPSGTLIIAVPNYKSFDANYYKEYWAAYDVPRHLYHFSRNTIKRIFSKYSISLIRTKPMYFDAYYVSLLSEKYKTGKSNYIKAFIIGSLSNLRAILNKEHSSLIYILKKD
ncbi:class I SAM-dependent methyltransferase [Flavobacteriaceae bacterium KMM 6897]|nr:class I SAM-dependent methyltransferase [Flavobacteriaceae bacterium KMM 6897]MEB8346254.1 class I SAM-dependent methyltransferase [Flavobacteriaceae bacterium KMM 6898]